MRPVKVEGSNIEMTVPGGQVDPLYGLGSTNELGIRTTETVWMPDDEDIRRINAGEFIYVKMWGENVPIHAAGTGRYNVIFL